MRGCGCDTLLLPVAGLTEVAAAAGVANGRAEVLFVAEVAGRRGGECDILVTEEVLLIAPEVATVDVIRGCCWEALVFKTHSKLFQERSGVAEVTAAVGSAAAPAMSRMPAMTVFAGLAKFAGVEVPGGGQMLAVGSVAGIAKVAGLATMAELP